MALIKLFIVLVICVGGSLAVAIKDYEGRSCKEIRTFQPNAPSGVYSIPAGNRFIEVYCEMGLNGGDYTFLSPKSTAEISNADLQSMITDRKSLLMKIRRCDGTQRYTVLEQLPKHAEVPISYMLSSWARYRPPVNLGLLGSPYLFAGFLPNSFEPILSPVQGIKSNGVSVTYTACGPGANGYIALFPNFGQKPPSNYGPVNPSFCDAIFNAARQDHSTRVMPPEFFMFGEFHFGGCGCYTQSDPLLISKCILGFQIGFR